MKSQANNVRKAAFAGSWYEVAPAKLQSQLDGYRGQVLREKSMETSVAKAIIGPHAGYRFSGLTSMCAYQYLRPVDGMRVFVLGPSHRKGFEGCSLPTCKTYATPLGDIQVDQSVVEELTSIGCFGVASQNVEEAEHSIEMHLPFIKHALAGKQFTIIPIMVGRTTEESEKQYAKILSKYWKEENNVFIISSDFCHWGERFQYTPYDESYDEIHKSIEAMDRRGMKAIETQNSKIFGEYLKETGNTICGRRAISIFMNLVGSDESKSMQTRFVHYSQSSHVRSAEDSSVSYAAGVTFNTTK